jgi:hypothetical protein
MIFSLKTLAEATIANELINVSIVGQPEPGVVGDESP